MKKYNTILTEKQQKYRHYHQVELINMNFITGEEILPSDQSRIIGAANCTTEDQGVKKTSLS